MAGFGQWIKDNFENESCGVSVIHRTDSNYSELVMTMADKVKAFYAMNDADVAKLRAAASKTSKSASWENFIKFSQEADFDVLDAAARSFATSASFIA